MITVANIEGLLSARPALSISVSFNPYNNPMK